jgi:hypothetical protein
LQLDIQEISFTDAFGKNEKQLNSHNISQISFDFVENKLHNFDHLSYIDPDDQWLKLETGSIAESIQIIRKSQQIAELSDFSIVGDDQQS